MYGRDKLRVHKDCPSSHVTLMKCTFLKLHIPFVWSREFETILRTVFCWRLHRFAKKKPLTNTHLLAFEMSWWNLETDQNTLIFSENVTKAHRLHSPWPMSKVTQSANVTYVCIEYEQWRVKCVVYAARQHDPFRQSGFAVSMSSYLVQQLSSWHFKRPDARLTRSEAVYGCDVSSPENF